MKNISDRQRDLLSIVRGLDISPTLYENAVEKYRALGDFLSTKGLEAVIYPQGSFALGTVVRPNVEDPAACYDLDFICQVKGSKTDYTPSGLRKQVEDILRSDKTYASRLTVNDKCFTISYADVNEIGFSIDIVPATDETFQNKARLSQKSDAPDLIDTSISIPSCNDDHSFQWITNNPKGLRRWFENINAPFLSAAKETERLRILSESRSVYASVEAIPSDLVHSALQRVIQILKYHRNRYYATLSFGDDVKPISAILNVIAAKIAEHYNPNCTVFELLEHVLSELTIYSEYQQTTAAAFSKKHGDRTVFSRPAGKWTIQNPANPDDNLADRWNLDDRIPTYFFRWVNSAQLDLIDHLRQQDDIQFRAILENSFGDNTVNRLLGRKYKNAPVREINSETAPRPYMI